MVLRRHGTTPGTWPSEAGERRCETTFAQVSNKPAHTTRVARGCNFLASVDGLCASLAPDRHYETDSQWTGEREDLWRRHT